eukprot:7854221-Ditylum_brightwellii.AAC.1
MACHSLTVAIDVAITVVIDKQMGSRAVVVVHTNGSTCTQLVFIITTFDIECAKLRGLFVPGFVCAGFT